jgi:hypothetical protein
MASPEESLVSVKVPSDAPALLKAWIWAVKVAGASAWIMAPALACGRLNVTVRGPLPPPLPLEVQTTVSPCGTPLPAQLQVPGAAGQVTESRLLAPLSLTVTALPAPEVALKLDPSNV